MIGKMWVAAFFVGVIAILWFTRHVVLLLFGAGLIALILTSLTNLLRRVVPLGRKTALLSVLLLLCSAVVGIGLLVGPSIAEEFGELADQLPKVFSEVREKVMASAAYQRIERFLPALKDMAPDGTGGVMKVFSSTFGAASSFIFIVFAALFLAAAPDLYIRMLTRLFPPRLRDAADQTIERVIRTLKQWLLGQLISMGAVGVITGVTFAVIGVPFAVELGILAGIGEFVPFVGPVLVSVPALLLALSEGTDKFLIVLAAVVVIQFIEGNLIMPIVQRKAVQLPPVITLASMLVLGGAFGLLGLFVAAPLVAVVLVLVEEVYLKRYLRSDDKLLE